MIEVYKTESMFEESRIEVMYKPGIDSRGNVIANGIRALIDEGVISPTRIDSIDVVDAYSISRPTNSTELSLLTGLLHDPVTQQARQANTHPDDAQVLEIGFKPGVTDNVASTVRKGIEAKIGQAFRDEESVHSSQVLVFRGDISDTAMQDIGTILANPLIQNIHHVPKGTDRQLQPYIPKVVLEDDPQSHTINLREMPHDKLKLIAKRGVIDPRTGEFRGPLSLDVDDAAPMKIIQSHYAGLGRDPTDVELECLAQTWSEHCKHTIFAARLDEGTDDEVTDGLYSTYIKGATNKIRARWKELGREDFLLSVFKDNSGIIKFDDRYAITLKVETHNSPSALDPYGGSITGIVGVFRDAIGAGMGAMPYNGRFFFCFADPKSRRQLFKSKTEDGTLEQRILSPRSTQDGVICGVKDGGNKSGIGTSQGSAFFHPNYGGKPLVFVGVDGVMPLEVMGKPSWEKQARPDDLVVMVGGRVGLDGIHGATFSSEAMDSGSPASAVQIGDPITQKKMMDALMEARDLGLYSSVTDNGAGGLSCSVYEMAKECGGATINVNDVPLKYPGMRPDQILISESQERMTLAVAPDRIDEFMEIMRKHDVESTVIGSFNDSGRCVAKFNNEAVLDLDIDFLHDGLPQRKLETTWTPELYVHEVPEIEESPDHSGLLHGMLSRLNICSKEFIYEQFDHEVQGVSVVKPMVGKGKADSDATLTRPVLDSMKGVANTQALLPRYSFIDTYDMAACAIDTAVRNMIAVGGKLDKTVLLDNFCWCSSDDPERLGQLKRAAKACHDVSTAYLTPLVSGKDSMFNTFKGFDEDGNPVKIDVPPTLMISGASIMPDVKKCQTLDAKVAGDLVYVIGTTRDELGGSEYYALLGEEEEGREEEYIGNNVPKVDVDTNLETYQRMENAIEEGLVASCTSVGLGGLGVALAKTAIGGQLGMELDIDNLYSAGMADGVDQGDTVLFSESMGRFVVTVDPSKREEFESALEGTAFAHIGNVTADDRFVLNYQGVEDIVNTSVSELTESYKSTLRDY